MATAPYGLYQLGNNSTRRCRRGAASGGGAPQAKRRWLPGCSSVLLVGPRVFKIRFPDDEVLTIDTIRREHDNIAAVAPEPQGDLPAQQQRENLPRIRVGADALSGKSIALWIQLEKSV
jgi:hypothetical protein